MTESDALSASSGFTLMELIVVTCLLSLFLMFSIPRLQLVMPTDHLNATVRWLIFTVSELKNTAVQNSRFYILHLDMDHRLIWVTHEAMTEAEIQAAKKNGFRLPANVRILDVEMPDSGKASSGSADIAFSSRGYSSKAIIHLQDKGGSPVSLLIEPFISGASYYGRRISFQEG
ncbi:MAG: prepilin-type N-terminal cleavage/methylation domain-containing protein [Deltaproteobacteria bacterium]|nr:prepilin-type N-terminal cleavage/methylation domain-containing protein [Deltaproteobacteria bacterium]